MKRSKLSSSVVKEVGVSAISTGVTVPAKVGISATIATLTTVSTGVPVSTEVGVSAISPVISSVTTVPTVSAVTTMTALIRNLRALI